MHICASSSEVTSHTHLVFELVDEFLLKLDSKISTDAEFLIARKLRRFLYLKPEARTLENDSTPLVLELPVVGIAPSKIGPLRPSVPQVPQDHTNPCLHMEQ